MYNIQNYNKSSSQNSPRTNRAHRIKQKNAAVGVYPSKGSHPTHFSSAIDPVDRHHQNRLKVSFQRIWYAAELLRLAFTRKSNK